MDKVLSSTSYREKQEAFRNFVKDVQSSLGSKEYHKIGVPIEKFVKMKWNISKAQAYRYVVCGKVLDQLKEFEIQPCHERLCRSLNNTAKTPAQMKLLWSTVIRRFKPENINSTNVIKVWKELYADERYYDICHYEDKIIKRVENTLNKLSNQMKSKHLKENKQLSLSDISIPSQSEYIIPIIPSQSEHIIPTIPNQSNNIIPTIPNQSNNIIPTIPNQSNNIISTVPSQSNNIIPTIPSQSNNIIPTIPNQSNNIIPTVPSQSNNIIPNIPRQSEFNNYLPSPKNVEYCDNNNYNPYNLSNLQNEDCNQCNIHLQSKLKQSQKNQFLVYYQ